MVLGRQLTGRTLKSSFCSEQKAGVCNAKDSNRIVLTQGMLTRQLPLLWRERLPLPS